MPAATTARQVNAFIGKFEPKHQTLIRAVRRGLRSRLRGAYELVYDNYNFFVIAFGTTERPSDAVLSLAADANGVTVFFVNGATLSDPHKLLAGSGKQVRSSRVPDAAVLAKPAVGALIRAAVAQNGKPLPGGTAKVIVRSISAKQRPRRKLR